MAEEITEPDAQATAELFDEETTDTEEPTVHSELLGPDAGGNDDVAELVGDLTDAEGPIGPEDAAVHVEPAPGAADS